MAVDAAALPISGKGRVLVYSFASVTSGTPRNWAAGDFLNDYEGIRGYEDYRDDLAVMYFVDIVATSGTVSRVELVPLCIKQFQLVPATAADLEWVRKTLDRESRQFITSVTIAASGRLTLSSTATSTFDSHQ